MSADYWVEIGRDDERLGAGFLLTKRYVLTALHCLKGTSPGDDEVRISFPGVSGQGVPGRVSERAKEADLALVEVLERLPLIVPVPDRCAAGDLWHGPYRPRDSDPYLGGTVSSESVEYRCESGSVIEALQLAVREDFGDYSGYSGGPIERVVRDTRQSAKNGGVVGILLEQYPDRKEVKRASRTLFAATIAEAVRRFDCFDVRNLLDLLHPAPLAEPTVTDSNMADRNRSDLETDIAYAKRLLQFIHECGVERYLDAPEVTTFKVRILENLIDGGRRE